MKSLHNYSVAHRLLAGALAATLCGSPCLMAQTVNPDSQSATTNTTNNAQTNNAQNVPDTPAPQDPRLGSTDSAMPDPSRGPQKPVQQINTTTTTNVPSTAVNTQANQTANQQKPATANAEYQEPSGAAAAQRGTTDGGAASRPAGTAIAPARQHRVRSLVIKVGAVVAGAAALGTVYALSHGTSSTPPGAHTAASSH